MKTRRKSDPIHINGLPKDLVENILSRLPIQDAVGTSILSKKWRYAWTGLRKLVFDNRFCENLNTNSKLIKAIYQVLLLHNGPLNTFKLHIANLESSSFEVDQFVLVVLRKGVKDLFLCVRKDEPYRLPSSVFAYGQQLEHLQLWSCVFEPPPGFGGFSNLDSLVLDEVGISGSRLSSIISHCPVLTRLSFKSSASCDGIDIVAPNLKLLRIECLCKSLCFTSTPKLAIVEIYAGPVKYSIVLEIEASSQSRLPVVEELALDDFCMEFIASNRASMLVKDLRLLKTLSLFNVSFGLLGFIVDVYRPLHLVRDCPNLETLKIVFQACTRTCALEPANTEADDISLDHLKKVELRQVSGLKYELQLIKLILAKSPVLEKFLIEPRPELVGDKAFKFLKELTRFRRASPLVEIAYEG